MEVINANARNTIDLRRADLMLKALHIAVKNAQRVRFDTLPSRMVHEVPRLPRPTKAGPRRARSNGRGSRDRNVPSRSGRIRGSRRSRPAQAPSQRPGTSEAAQECSPRLASVELGYGVSNCNSIAALVWHTGAGVGTDVHWDSDLLCG